MRYLCFALFLFCSIFCIDAQHVLKFNSEGKFKIVQFTDVHNIYGDSRSQVALQRLKEILVVEKPDLVIITGDLIYGKPVQSYSFFYIPLPEYSYAIENQKSVMIGTRMEPVCSSELNSGMFASMKEMGDMRGVFVGHDHDNDYAVYWNNILLAYGRYSGGNTVYNHLSNGARVIELNEDGRTFTTWITLAEVKVINKVVCPDDFVKEKNKNM